MRQRTMWLAGAGVGGATAYLLDPASGNQRRKRVADTIVHYTNETGDTAVTVGRDLRNRTRGVVVSLQRKILPKTTDDRVLQERLHAAIGRVVSHPHAITVTARGGDVILGGQIVPSEELRLVSTVQAIDGVKNVETRFERHTQAADVSSLQ